MFSKMDAGVQIKSNGPPCSGQRAGSTLLYRKIGGGVRHSGGSLVVSQINIKQKHGRFRTLSNELESQVCDEFRIWVLQKMKVRTSLTIRDHILLRLIMYYRRRTEFLFSTVMTSLKCSRYTMLCRFNLENVFLTTLKWSHSTGLYSFKSLTVWLPGTI